MTASMMHPVPLKGYYGRSLGFSRKHRKFYTLAVLVTDNCASKFNIICIGTKQPLRFAYAPFLLHN